MLSIGEVFIYGTSGIVKVSGITSRRVGKEMQDYYILQPIFDECSTLYIPTDSEKLQYNRKEVLTKNQVLEIIDSIFSDNPQWIVNDKERIEVFRQWIDDGDRNNIASLIRSVYLHKIQLAEKGKKLRSSDEALMQRAERLLFGEMAYVLGIKPCEVKAFISERIG